MERLTLAQRPLGGEVVTSARARSWLRRYLHKPAPWPELLLSILLNQRRADPLRALADLAAVQPLTLDEITALLDLEMAELRRAVPPQAEARARGARRVLQEDDVAEALAGYRRRDEEDAAGDLAAWLNAARADGLRELRERAERADHPIALIEWAERRAAELAPCIELAEPGEAQPFFA